MTKEKKRFLITEAVLLLAAAFFAFALVGYSTIGLVLLGVAAVIALFRLFSTHFEEKTQKTLKTVLTVCVCLGVAAIIAVEIPIVTAARGDKNPEAPYLIVLGAGVNGEAPSLSLVNRLDAALEYLEEYPDSIAVVSGSQGAGEDITEAECMRRWLEEKGIEAERIIMEEQAGSTYENIAFSLEKIAENGGNVRGSVAIASSEYHLYRAKYIAAELGAEPYGVAGRTSYPVLMLNYFLREAAAVAVMWLT